MEPECSWPCSQQPVTCPYPEPNKSVPLPAFLFRISTAVHGISPIYAQMTFPQISLYFTSSPYVLLTSPLRTGLFKMIVRVIHNTLQMQPHVPSFYGVTSRIRFMFLFFPQVSRNWRYESEPPLKLSMLTCGTNSFIVLMFVESQRVHI